MVLSNEGKVIVNEAFGYSNVRKKVAANTSNLHRIASISKVFTKFALLRLVEQ